MLAVAVYEYFFGMWVYQIQHILIFSFLCFGFAYRFFCVSYGIYRLYVLVLFDRVDWICEVGKVYVLLFRIKDRMLEDHKLLLLHSINRARVSRKFRCPHSKSQLLRHVFNTSCQVCLSSLIFCCIFSSIRLKWLCNTCDGLLRRRQSLIL